MSVATDLLTSLVPSVLELLRLLHAGEVEKAERKALAIAQAIGLRKLGRATAKAVKR
jgi:hypothetical protein